jgi:DNA-directed RNA polymerase subunit alpha
MTQTTDPDVPVATEVPFDLKTDPIPSFGALQQERAKVFGRQEGLDSFSNSVRLLTDAGEEGRRKGLGMWLIGEFDQAVKLLDGHEQDDVASFTCANALMALDRPQDARPIFERLSQKYPGEPRPRGGWLAAQFDADLASAGTEQAIERLQASLTSAPEGFAESAEARFLRGRVAELSHQYQTALDEYTAAREADPTHRPNLFRLAYMAERTGNEETSLDCYQSLASMLPIDYTVLMNIGVLYEDLGRDQEAAACYDMAARAFPTNRRARLYLADAKAGMEMYYDEDMEKKEDRLNQILRTPITDFELSVRARNCLNKMEILTLGDLVKKTEAELLSYKNFGETSLTEIKEILSSKGLRLGMAREEAVASIAKANTGTTAPPDPNDVSSLLVADMNLSIRARRTVENIGAMTLGDIAAHSEEELLGMPNFGVTSLLELKNKLTEYGLKLRDAKD